MSPYDPPPPELCWSSVAEEPQQELERERYGDLHAAERGTTLEQGARATRRSVDFLLSCRGDICPPVLSSRVRPSSDRGAACRERY